MEIKRYWALSSTNDIAQEINDKMVEYRRFLYDSGYSYKLQTAYDAYYGNKSGAFGIETLDNGKSKIQANHLKSLIQRLHNLCTQAKLSWQTRARNSDAKSQIQADFGKGLLEYYGDSRNLNRVLKRAVETSLVMFESFIFAPWDFNAGEDIRPDESGRPIRQGDQSFKVLHAFNVARPQMDTENPWYIIETTQNRYDLAAQYPEFQEQILGASMPIRDSAINDYLVTPFNTIDVEQDEDHVTIHYLFHPRTSAVPEGRETLVCNNTVLYDRALMYSKLPVVRISAGDIIDAVVGDSPNSSLISLQDGFDRLLSAVSTNNLNGAVQNIYSQDPNISLQKINEGMNLIKATAEPKAIAMVNSAKETYNLLTEYVNHMQLLSGVNATARGNPEESVSTAGGQALMIAQAIQFVSDLQASYAQAASELGTIIIKNLQKFASEPRLAYIGGISKKAYVKQFTSEDLADIDRVSVDLGDPMTQTIAGRWELVQQWVQMSMIKDPAKMIEFLRTGQADSLTEDQFKDSILIREENEQLKRGEVPLVLMTDLHPQHILEHKQCLSDPVARMDPQVNQAVLEHIQAHIEAYKSIDQDLAAILGLPPLPSMMQPPPVMEANSDIPSVNGQPLPNVPEETPPQVEQTYNQFAEQASQSPEGQEI
jgi:hypothetical protein